MILGRTSTGEPLGIDLQRLIGSHACVVANSGGGKSTLIRRMVEISHGQVQQIILDPEDEFYTLRERHDFVVAGGDGGDIPARLESASQLAFTALQHGFSLIVQLNDLGEDGPAFVGDFLSALIAAPRDLWRPLLVILDETQRFAPSEGQTSATHGVRALAAQGRKRGFTGIFASQRIAKIDPHVRGDINNWILGRVGQSLDRRTVADALGFAPSSAEARGLQGLEDCNFWGFGPAIAREPVLFRVDDPETTRVRPGQAKVPTPPAPEALREILAGLAKVDDHRADVSKLVRLEMAENSDLQRLVDENAELRAKLVQAEDAGAEWRERARQLATAIAHAEVALSRVDEIPAQGGGCPEVDEGQTEGRQVMKSATPRATAPAPAARTATEKAGGGNASPAALAIADLLDRINPARVTWSQAVAMTGRKASGGSFNAARKWLRGSGRIVEEGVLIRSSADAPAGMARAEALDLWRSVLSNPAPKMIDALVHHHDLTKEELGAAIGAQPRGGNFNNGLAQLRRNGLLYEYGSGTLRLAEPLPGERSDGR